MNDVGAVSVAPRAAFQHPSFRLYQIARFLAVVGSQMQSVAVAWQVYAIRHRPIDLAFVGLAQFVQERLVAQH